MKKKKQYYIEYWDKYGTIKATTIKAFSENDAERRFYKTNLYDLIRKVSLI